MSYSLPLSGTEVDSLRRLLQTASPDIKARLLNDLSQQIAEEEPEKSAEYASEALKLAISQGNRLEEARSYFRLAESCVIRGDLAASIPYYEQSAEIELVENGAGSKGHAERIGDIGYCYYTMEQPVKALEYLRQSLDYSIRYGWDKQAASMYSNIGAIYIEWGDYDKGLLNNQLALVIDRKSGDYDLISTDLNNIGKTYEQWGKYELAVKYYLEALEMSRKAGNHSRIAIRLNNLGIVYKAWKRYPEALQYFQEALSIDREIGNRAKEGKRLAYIGATYLEMGDHPKSLIYLDSAAPLIRASGQQDEIARLFNLYGRYYLKVNMPLKAVACFRQSQEQAVSNNLKPLQMGNLKGLSDALKEMGKPMEALDALTKYMMIKDSVFTETSDRRLAEFQARFENEKIKLENDMLRKDMEIRKNRVILSGLIAAILLVILAGVIVILRLRNRNALQAKELAERKVEEFRTDLETRDKELALQAMHIIRNNETITSVIEGLERNHTGQSEEDLSQALSKIKNLGKEKSWKEFEMLFTRVHTDFYTRLHERFPNLTPNERKLCAFLRLNMSTKDIASITHQSIHSINVARTRLRRKMNLANSDESLITFLMNL